MGREQRWGRQGTARGARLRDAREPGPGREPARAGVTASGTAAGGGERPGHLWENPQLAVSTDACRCSVWSLRTELRIQAGPPCARPRPPSPARLGSGPWPGGRAAAPRYLKVDCSSLKAAFRCFISSACFFRSSCSALISSSKRLDTLMAWTWGGEVGLRAGGSAQQGARLPFSLALNQVRAPNLGASVSPFRA